MWPILTRLVNILWWLGLLATLVVLGYFAGLGLGVWKQTATERGTLGADSDDGKLTMFAQCWPDTVDPRGPKSGQR